MTDPFGLTPKYKDINWEGIDFDKETFFRLMEVHRQGVKEEAEELAHLFPKFGDHLPAALEVQGKDIEIRANKAPEIWTSFNE